MSDEDMILELEREMTGRHCPSGRAGARVPTPALTQCSFEGKLVPWPFIPAPTHRPAMK